MNDPGSGYQGPKEKNKACTVATMKQKSLLETLTTTWETDSDWKLPGSIEIGL